MFYEFYLNLISFFSNNYYFKPIRYQSFCCLLNPLPRIVLPVVLFYLDNGSRYPYLCYLQCNLGCLSLHLCLFLKKNRYCSCLGNSYSDLRPELDIHVCFFVCSVSQSCPTLCSPTDCSTPGLPVLHHIPDFASTHVRCVIDALQAPHPISPTSLTISLSQHQGLFQ